MHVSPVWPSHDGLAEKQIPAKFIAGIFVVSQEPIGQSIFEL
jgi:hypothetical protein